MTAERKEQIRKVCVEWDMPSAKAAQELLAEVDRLEAVARSYLGEAHDWRRLAAERRDRIAKLEQQLADRESECVALREYVYGPLDSPPANR